MPEPLFEPGCKLVWFCCKNHFFSGLVCFFRRTIEEHFHIDFIFLNQRLLLEVTSCKQREFYWGLHAHSAGEFLELEITGTFKILSVWIYAELVQPDLQMTPWFSQCCDQPCWAHENLQYSTKTLMVRCFTCRRNPDTIIWVVFWILSWQHHWWLWREIMT